MSLTFDLLWRDHGAAAGLKNLGSQTASAAQGFDKLSQASAKATTSLAKAQDAAASASARLRISEMRLADLRKSGSQDATKLATAEAAVESARRRSVSTTAAVSSASQRLAQAQQAEQGRMGKVSAAYATATASVGKLGKVGGLALVGLGASAVAFGVKTASGNEQATISFTTMLGSAQKAQALLKQLRDFAATTPFTFPELQTAAANLISVGINAKDVIPLMRTLGDVTSGMGTGAEGIKRAVIALQQMNAAQAIHAQDLNQLRDAGIPVYDLLSAALGKSKAEVVGLAQAGKLGKDALDKMMAALESGKGLERFNGLMQAQSQSLAGLASNLNDALGQGLAKAIEPLIPLMKVGLGGAIDLTTNHMDALITVGGAFFAMWSVHKLAGIASSMAETAVEGSRFARSLTGTAGLLGGPWGAAIGIGVSLIGAFALKQQIAAAQTKAFTDSLTFQNGALDANSRATLAKKLADEGALAAAKTAGIAESDYVHALLAGGDARTQMIKKLGDIIVRTGDMNVETQGNTQALFDQNAAAQKAQDALKYLGGQLDESASSAAMTANALKDTASATHLTLSPSAQLSKLTGDMAAKEKVLAGQLQQVINKFTILKQGALDQANADIAWQASIDAVSASVKQNGRSLDIHTDKGRQNRTALIGMMTALNDKTTADVKNAGVVHKGETATDAYSRVLRVARTDTKNGEKAIRDAAAAAHLNSDQVNAMIRQYLKTPKQVATEVKANGVDKTVAQIKSVQQHMDDLRNKEVHINFATNATQVANVLVPSAGNSHHMVRLKVPLNADGGLIRGPGSGTSDSILGIDHNGIPTSRVSNGEFVVREKQTRKHLGLLHAINAGLGVFADGGVVRRALNVNTGRVPASAGQIPGDAGLFADAFSRVAGSIIAAVLGNALSSSGGAFGPALAFARAQAGKPYIWAAAGPGGYDCSGFMGAIENVILGQSPYHRRWSTGNFHGQNSFDHFKLNARSPFMIGVTNAGVGHTAGTLNGVNVESRGGQGVVIGKNARGWNDPLFTMHYGFTGTPAVGGGGFGGGGQSSGGIRGLARSMLNARGWGNEYSSLNYVISHESGWDPHARNSSSGAYGLGQALPASKMAGFGPDYRNNAQTQLNWMLNYIGGRYGDPRGAERFWRGHHWYGSGGTFDRPTIIGVGESGRERVLNPVETRRYERMERQGGGYGANVYVTVNAPNYVGSVKDLEAAMLQSARSGGMKKVLREVGVKI